jgi:hypothetical protein
MRYVYVKQLQDVQQIFDEFILKIEINIYLKNYRGLSLAISEFIFEYIMLLSRLLIKFNDLFFFYLLTN